MRGRGLIVCKFLATALLGAACAVAWAAPALAQRPPTEEGSGQPTTETGDAEAGTPAAGGGANAEAKAAAPASQDLAKTLLNPVASLIAVPFQFNWDEGLGPNGEGRRFLLNFQPVMPFSLGPNWNLITRLIVPLVAQPVLTPGGQSSFGLGDLLLSLFLSPARGAVIWGVGPAIGLPVTSDPLLGSGKYTLGPTAVVLVQEGILTFGALVNHLWSVGGDEGRANVSQLYLQPFVAIAIAGWSLALNTETTANWKAADGEKWTVPINLVGSKVVKLGSTPISIGAGPRYYAVAPTGGPNWGFRLGITLMFPAAPAS